MISIGHPDVSQLAGRKFGESSAIRQTKTTQITTYS